jgi:membrane-associated progesterone receptor component
LAQVKVSRKSDRNYDHECAINDMSLSLNFATPVNTALLIYILYSVQKIVFPPISTLKATPHEFKQGYSWMPKFHAPTVLFQTYTPKTLVPFDGKDNGRILLAINGIVFDVTAGRSFYGPGAHSSFELFRA